MKQHNKILLQAAGLCASLCVAGVSHAATIGYDFEHVVNTGSNPPNLAPSFTDPAIDLGDIAIGSGLTESISGFGDNSGSPFSQFPSTSVDGPQSLQIGSGQADQTSLANAISSDHFFSFTVGPGSGSIDISEIAFKADRNNTDGAEFWSLHSDIGGFTDTDSIQQGTITSADGGNTAYQAFTITLGSAFDGLTSDTEFRLYLWGADNASNATRFDKVAVTAVPEPSAFGFALGAISLALVWRRFRSR